MPNVHKTQAPTLSTRYPPAAQAAHESEDVEPVTVLNKPLLQAVQADKPTIAAYVLTPHEVHAVLPVESEL